MTALEGDDVRRSDVLCMLMVPATLSSQDILQFIAPTSSCIRQMKIIRDASPNQYMVLLKFRSQKLADEFYGCYNGTEFNSLEPHVCHLVYVARVEAITESECGAVVEGCTELPTCPVCLERMDESVDGVLTILCNHSFHGSCLSQWGDTSCPVCRYSQTPELTVENKCFECGNEADLWICLICGNIGCGRYAHGHAYNHFRDTSHTFSLQAGTQRVWDYAGDNYVHRLIQSKTDGKVVEYEPAQRNPEQVEGEEKMEGITLEYTYLLTNQLDAQRMFFEDKLANIEKLAHAQIEQLEDQLVATSSKCDELQTQFSSLVAEKQQTEKRLHASSTKLQKVQAELAEERQLNTCLRNDQRQWHDKVDTLEKGLAHVKDAKDKVIAQTCWKLEVTDTLDTPANDEVGDLQEQLRDLMFHLESESKIQQQTNEVQDEITEGHIVLGEAKPTKKSKKKK